MTGPPQLEPGPAVVVEDDPPPVVRALANDLRARLGDSEFAIATARARGTIEVGDRASPQAAAIELGDGEIRIAHGRRAAAEVRASVDLRSGGEPTIDGETANPLLAEWARELLGADPEPWPEAAARCWRVLTGMAGAPEALLVVDLEDDEELRLGTPAGRAYELHGGPEALAAVLSGRRSLVDAAFAGEVFVRGTFAELSVLSGAGFRVRYGEDAFVGGTRG